LSRPIFVARDAFVRFAVDSLRGAGPQEDELLAVLKAKDHPVCYDGFEPSGRMHIAQGILKAINVSVCRHVRHL
jgi:hypothetical protein